MLDTEKMKQKLQSVLSVKRYIHTLGVADEAVKLAEIYGGDTLKSKARTAALLHDCARDYPEAMTRRFCKEYHIPLDEIMRKQIYLAHSFLGAEVAKREYLVDDQEVLEAIRFHTTGKPNMSILDKIIFIADYIEPNRKSFQGLSEARILAYTDIDSAMELILKNTIDYVLERKQTLHPFTQEAFEFYKNQQKEEKE